MKTKLLNVTILLVLAMSWTVMALDRLPRPEDATYMENVQNLIKALLLLAFLTPFGWGILALIIIGTVSALAKGAKKVATTDFSVIPATEKRDLLLEELEKASRG
jgi:hypothetical protein